MNISIISPCFNESKNIANFVNKIFSIFKKKKIELIIVDDNSVDGTKKILLKLKEKYKNLKIIFRRKKPRDLSRSCFLGIKSAKFKILVVLDCDMQHQPKDIIKLYNKIKKTKSDIVVGSRNLLKRNKGLGVLRQICSMLIIFTFNFFLGKKTCDPMSGFFIFNKDVYNSKNIYYARGFKILIDLIYNSKKKIKISDIDINFKLRRRNQSKMNLNILFYIIDFIFKSLIKKITAFNK